MKTPAARSTSATAGSVQCARTVRYADILRRAFNWHVTVGRGPNVHRLTVWSVEPDVPSLVRKTFNNVEEITKPGRFYMVEFTRRCTEEHVVPVPQPRP